MAACRPARLALVLLWPWLAACDMAGGPDRPGSADTFPAADRPVAPIVSTEWSTEDARDKVGEAEAVMAEAGIQPGMTVADIGAGEGYYTVRLAQRVGTQGRVLAQDIQPAVISRLADRVGREKLDNVSLKLGAADDPRLPAASFDRVFLVHMYHEIAEPYAFLWRLMPALREGGEVIVVDSQRPIAQHGTPLRLLTCEFEAIGYRLVAFRDKPRAGSYVARFAPARPRPAPADIKVCRSDQS